MRFNKKAAIAAGVIAALGTAGTALATTITVSPTVAPTVAPVLVTPSVNDSFNITDSFLANSHNSGDSEFVDFSNGLNVLYNTVQLGDPHGGGLLGGVTNNVLAMLNISL
jgi:hypothetical protein